MDLSSSGPAGGGAGGKWGRAAIGNLTLWLEIDRAKLPLKCSAYNLQQLRNHHGRRHGTFQRGTQIVAAAPQVESKLGHARPTDGQVERGSPWQRPMLPTNDEGRLELLPATASVAMSLPAN